MQDGKTQVNTQSCSLLPMPDEACSFLKSKVKGERKREPALAYSQALYKVLFIQSHM